MILVGDDPASQIYVRNKIRACEKVGIESLEYRMPKETTQAELLAQIEALNNDDKVDGILVQLPLPDQLSSDEVIAAISPAKDVDGFHVASAGALMTGRPGFLPCTPYGVNDHRLLVHCVRTKYNKKDVDKQKSLAGRHWGKREFAVLIVVVAIVLLLLDIVIHAIRKRRKAKASA